MWPTVSTSSLEGGTWPPCSVPGCDVAKVENKGGLPVELAAEPIRGYRIWRVMPSAESSWALRSLRDHGVSWDRDMTAECLNENLPGWFRHRQEAPGARCSCGIYAQGPDRPIIDWNYVLNGRVKASGSILMWGRIIVCMSCRRAIISCASSVPRTKSSRSTTRAGCATGWRSTPIPAPS